MHWSEAPKNEAHKLLVPYLQELKTTYRDARLTWFETWLGMYADEANIALLPSRSNAIASPLFAQSNAVPLNVVRPLVDTAESLITLSKPRPNFLPVGGDWSKQRQTKNLQRFSDGILDRLFAYRIGAQCLKDAALFGTGVAKVYHDGKTIRLERVLISDVLVDEALGWDRNPPEITHVAEVSRRALIRRFPKHAAAIEKLIPVGSQMRSNWSDIVEVYETWYLAHDDDPGRHVIVIPGATLFDEEYKHEYSPLIFLRWSELASGFYGQGLAQQVTALQLELTRTMRNIGISLHLLANPKVLVAEQSNIPSGKVTNGVGTVVRYRAPYKPELWVSQVVSPEVYNWAERLYSKAFEITGISAQSAFSRKPAGADSGKALRELYEQQAGRLAPYSERYQNFYLDLITRVVDCAEDLHDRGVDLGVIQAQGSRANRFAWRDVRMPKDDYTVQLMAAGFLGRTPAGKFDDVKDLMAAQLIDPDTARKLLDVPDLEAYFAEFNADRDNLERQIEMVLDEGTFIDPSPFDNLKLGLRLYKLAFNRARQDSVPEDRIEMLERWIEQANEIVTAQAPPAPQQDVQPQAA
jgi:hypothetical protein